MLTIGEAAKQSGISAKMIRHYESINLLRPADRTQSNYRVYGQDDVHTLRFIARARSMGFSLEETRRLLDLWHDRSRASADVKRVAQSHVEALERKIDELAAMRDTLRHLASCCEGDDRPDCPILEDLAGR